MLSFLLNWLIAIASLIGLIFFVRYSLTLLSRFDRFFTKKYRHTSRGLKWGIRLPTRVGNLLEFYFYVIMGKKNFMNYSSWPVKLTLIISVFLFLAMLTGRSFVTEYYTLGLEWPTGYFSGGSKLWFLHLVNLSYLGVIALVAVDSVKMMGYFAPLRIGYFFIVMLASVGASVLSFSLFIAFSLVYLVLKVIGIFLTGGRRSYKREKKPSLLAKHYARFLEVHDAFDHPDIVNEEEYTTPEPVKEKRYFDNDIKKLYSD